MRRIERGSPPVSLQTLLDVDPTRYWSSAGESETHGQIRDQLVAVQDGLCGYCEVLLPVESPDQIRVEHLHPKSEPACSRRPSENCSYDWNNMVAVCGSAITCDGPKKNKHLCEVIVFPDDLDPLVHRFRINTYSGEIFADPTMDQFERDALSRTLQELNLNDDDLRLKRKSVARAVMNQLRTGDSKPLVRHCFACLGFPTTVDFVCR